MKTNVTLIVDSRKGKSNSANYPKVDPEYEAQGLAQAIKPLGRREQRLAIVSVDDTKGLTAFQNAGYQTIAMADDQPQDLRKFIGNMTWQMDTDPPDSMVIVTTDPDFTLLCDQAIRKNVRLSVWAPAANVPTDFMDPSYGFRPLEDFLPNIKVPRVDLRLDAENLLIGLQQRGWKMDPKALIEGVKAEALTLGSIVNVVAYADWTLLAKNTNRDFQRELAMLGVETRYQVNMRGKNSADMKIADDISTLLERSSDTPEAVDVIVLGTCDRDFRPTVDRAKNKGRRLVIFSIENGISWELRNAATEIRYLDQRFLKNGDSGSSTGNHCQASYRDAHMKLCMKLAKTLQQNNWKWVKAESFIKGEGENEDVVQQAVAAKLLLASTRTVKDDAGNSFEVETLALNLSCTPARVVDYLVRWVKNRIQYCLNEKHMPYVDTNFLANGMALDSTLQKWGVGQDRHEVSGWLHVALEAGIVDKVMHDNPKSPGKTVATWKVAEMTRPESSIGMAGDSPTVMAGEYQHEGNAEELGQLANKNDSNPEKETVKQDKNQLAPGFPIGQPKTEADKSHRWLMPVILQPPSHSTTNAG